MTFGYENLFIFGTFPIFMHNIRNVTRGQVEYSPDVESLRWPKLTTMPKTIFQNSRFASQRPQVRIWESQTFLLSQASSNLVTPLHITIVLLEWHNLLTKLPAHQWQIINHKKLKQNAVDYRNHLTIENNLKVEKKVYYFETKHNFPFSHKTLGVCVEANTPKNSKAIMHFAKKLFIAS